jgi:hypothetical protein
MDTSDEERDGEGLRLEPEEVDAALRLLRDEQEQPDEGVRLLLLELLEDLALGVALTGFVVGFTTIFVDRTIGFVFLAIGLVGFVIAGIDYKTPWARSKLLLGVVGMSKADARRDALEKAWQKESHFLAGGISLFIAVAAYGLLLYKVVADDAVSWVAIIIIALCAVVNATDFAIDEYRKYRYYQRQLGSALDALTHERGADDESELAVSEVVADTLERAEERRLARVVSAAATRLGQRNDDAYAVHIATAPRDRLLALQPSVALELREAMDKLQGLAVVGSPGDADEARPRTIAVAGYDIAYEIDATAHRVDVVAITERADGDAA